MASNTIQCYRCGHVFDHNPKYSKHCLCAGCRVSISIPDARREYLARSNTAGAVSVSPLTGQRAQNYVAPRKLDKDIGLPPVARDEHGQPLPKARDGVHRGDTPRWDHNYFADIAKGAKKIAEDTARRVANANGPIDEEPQF